MVSQLSAKFSVFVLFITYTSGLSDFYDAFPTYSSNLDSYCPVLSAPQWDPVTNVVLPGLSPPHDEYCDACNRGRRSLSLYYPPALLPPASMSCWPSNPIPQILTIDSSMLGKPFDHVTHKLPVYIQMVELPSCMAEFSCKEVACKEIACKEVKSKEVTTHAPATEKPDKGLSELAKPVIGAIKDAAKKAGMLEDAVAAKLIDLSSLMPTPEPQLLDPTTTPGPEAPAEEEAQGTPPPPAEENAEMVDGSLPPKMPPVSSACIDPGASRCFIETISRPRLDYISYELDMPH